VRHVPHRTLPVHLSFSGVAATPSSSLVGMRGGCEPHHSRLLRLVPHHILRLLGCWGSLPLTPTYVLSLAPGVVVYRTVGRMPAGRSVIMLPIKMAESPIGVPPYACSSTPEILAAATGIFPTISPAILALSLCHRRNIPIGGTIVVKIARSFVCHGLYAPFSTISRVCFLHRDRDRPCIPT